MVSDLGYGSGCDSRTGNNEGGREAESPFMAVAFLDSPEAKVSNTVACFRPYGVGVIMIDMSKPMHKWILNTTPLRINKNMLGSACMLNEGEIAPPKWS